ncbi:13961_t:CDS:2 [Cetraspora pellucida]|uniref:13961_t:CDS:1 n=1 Tax=Cetraspora pellucida TaxID=1433469 RepID=A0ACA9MV96_9GLOM|nr:13961_t:CDS:2 [Cetraspora pellucida]
MGAAVTALMGVAVMALMGIAVTALMSIAVTALMNVAVTALIERCCNQILTQFQTPRLSTYKASTPELQTRTFNKNSSN